MLSGVSKFTKLVAMLALALWGLAAMHCTLEGVPGFDFLKSCCFAEAETAAPPDCESDGCGAVEDGNYRPEEQNTATPQPLLIVALLSSAVEVPLTELALCSATVSHPPPELPRVWQFSYRTALPPRAPSFVA